MAKSKNTGTGGATSATSAEVMIDDRGAPRIPIDLIVEAKENTRRSSWGDMDGLVASIVANGQLHAGKVRPIPGGRYELVSGARRFRAVLRANLSWFRAEIETMTDAQAHEERLVENNQREDLSPLEEAHAFATSLDQHGRTVEEVAAKLGRSPTYVRQRLRLLELVPEVQALIAEGRLAPTTAMLIAAMPHLVQDDVAQAVSGTRGYGGGYLGSTTSAFISRSDVEEAIAGLCRPIASAPFDTTDADLNPEAGACTTCPSRTGTQGVLFEEANRTDVCLSKSCWDVKLDALWKRKTVSAREAGQVVLEGEEAEKVRASLGNYGTSKYVKLDDRIDWTTEEKWRAVVGPDVVPMLLRDQQTNEPVEVIARDIALQALAAKRPKATKAIEKERALLEGSDDREQAYKDEAKKAAEKAKIEADGERRAMAALVASIEAPGDTEERRADLQRKFVVAMMHGTWADTLSDVCKRRGWGREDSSARGGKLDAAEVITREMADMNAGQIAALAVELVATRAKQAAYGDEQSGFEMLCESRGVDIAHHMREAKKAAAERKREKREKEKAKEKGAKGKASKKGKPSSEPSEEEINEALRHDNADDDALDAAEE